MMVLENESLKVEVAAKGAELKSIWGKAAQREYLWSGDPAFWAKTSPVLFPIVGALKNDTYFYQGREYHLSRHGFARDREFGMHRISSTEVLFTLTDTTDTKDIYPFSFKLGLRYRLSGKSLSCTYEVENPDDSPLLFSIGGHPAFAAGGTEGLDYRDWYLVFEEDDELVYHPILDNLIAEKTETLALADHRLGLKHELFYNDALVLKSLKSKRVSLLNQKDRHGLLFSFPDFPYFGIWAAKDANFVCLEPWCGVADGMKHHQLLEDKEGIVTLPAGGSWSRAWEVTLV